MISSTEPFSIGTPRAPQSIYGGSARALVIMSKNQLFDMSGYKRYIYGLIYLFGAPSNISPSKRVQSPKF